MTTITKDLWIALYWKGGIGVAIEAIGPFSTSEEATKYVDSEGEKTKAQGLTPLRVVLTRALRQ